MKKLYWGIATLIIILIISFSVVMLRDNIETEKISVSPHGFGPYPEIPEDYPYPHVDWSKYHDNPMLELMTRVQIRLWKQGHRTEGILEKSNGLLYPISRGTVYVQRSYNGVYSSGTITGHPRDLSDDVKQQLMAGEIPAGLTVLDYDKGIDPYKFLNIRRMSE